MDEKHIHNPPEDLAIGQYESRVTKTYGELGREGVGVKTWGQIEYNGEWINLYTNREFIYVQFTYRIMRYIEQHPEAKNGLTLVDFGGGDGFLLDEVTKQLKELGIDQVTSTNLDLDPSGKS